MSGIDLPGRKVPGPALSPPPALPTWDLEDKGLC